MITYKSIFDLSKNKIFLDCAKKAADWLIKNAQEKNETKKEV